MGTRWTDLATGHPYLDRFHLPAHVGPDIRRIFPRRAQEGGEGGGVLHHLCYRLLRLQHRHVGRWRRDIESEQAEQQRKRHLGLELQRQPKKAAL